MTFRSVFRFEYAKNHAEIFYEKVFLDNPSKYAEKHYTPLQPTCYINGFDPCGWVAIPAYLRTTISLKQFEQTLPSVQKNEKIINNLSYNIQADILCNYCSLVIDVKILSKLWNLKN